MDARAARLEKRNSPGSTKKGIKKEKDKPPPKKPTETKKPPPPMDLNLVCRLTNAGSGCASRMLLATRCSCHLILGGERSAELDCLTTLVADRLRALVFLC